MHFYIDICEFMQFHFQINEKIDELNVELI